MKLKRVLVMNNGFKNCGNWGETGTKIGLINLL